jgi:D-lyxose ketol-isomerase
MYKIGIKHNGAIIATTELSKEEDKKLEESISNNTSVKNALAFIVDLFEKKFGLDIGQYGVNEYENFIGHFFILIRNEDLQKLREEKLTKLGL